MSFIINPYILSVTSSFSPSDISGLKLWLKADAINGLSDGDPVATWEDSSGEGNDGTQSISLSRPSYQTNEINGLPIVRFDGTTGQWFDLPDFASSFTAAEIFIVIKINEDPPGATNRTGLWRFRGGGVSNTHYPWVDNTIYESFAADPRHTTVDPTPSLTSWRLYNVASATNDYTTRLDGTQLYNSGSNTVSIGTTVMLGAGDGTYFLNGDVAEVIMYDSVLSSGDRNDVESYIASKYGLSIS